MVRVRLFEASRPGGGVHGASAACIRGGCGIGGGWRLAEALTGNMRQQSSALVGQHAGDSHQRHVERTREKCLGIFIMGESQTRGDGPRRKRWRGPY